MSLVPGRITNCWNSLSHFPLWQQSRLPGPPSNIEEFGGRAVRGSGVELDSREDERLQRLPHPQKPRQKPAGQVDGPGQAGVPLLSPFPSPPLTPTLSPVVPSLVPLLRGSPPPSASDWSVRGFFPLDSGSMLSSLSLRFPGGGVAEDGGDGRRGLSSLPLGDSSAFASVGDGGLGREWGPIEVGNKSMPKLVERGLTRVENIWRGRGSKTERGKEMTRCLGVDLEHAGMKWQAP